MPIREAQVNDVAGIAALMEQGVSEGTLGKRKREEIRRNIGRFQVAEEDNKIVGICSYLIYSKRFGEVRSLYVAPSYRGNGIAQELVEATTKEAFQHTQRVFTVTNNAIKIFERAGYGTTQTFESGGKDHPGMSIIYTVKPK